MHMVQVLAGEKVVGHKTFVDQESAELEAEKTWNRFSNVAETRGFTEVRTLDDRGEIGIQFEF